MNEENSKKTKYEKALSVIRNRFTYSRSLSQEGYFFYRMYLLYDLVSLKNVFNSALETYRSTDIIDIDLLFLNYEWWENDCTWICEEIYEDEEDDVLLDKNDKYQLREDVLDDYDLLYGMSRMLNNTYMQETISASGTLDKLNSYMAKLTFVAHDDLLNVMDDLSEELMNVTDNRCSLLVDTMLEKYKNSDYTLRRDYLNTQKEYTNKLGRWTIEQKESWIEKCMKRLDDINFWENFDFPYDKKQKEKLLSEYNKNWEIGEDCYLKFRWFFNRNQNRYEIDQKNAGKYILNSVLDKKLKLEDIEAFVDVWELIKIINEDIQDVGCNKSGKNQEKQIMELLKDLVASMDKDGLLSEADRDRLQYFFEELLKDEKNKYRGYIVKKMRGTGRVKHRIMNISCAPLLMLFGVLSREGALDLSDKDIQEWWMRKASNMSEDTYSRYFNGGKNKTEPWTEGGSKAKENSKDTYEYIKNIVDWVTIL